MEPLILSMIGLASGVLSHVLYFNKGEHHMWAVAYIQLSFTGFVLASISLVKLLNWTVSAALATTSLFAASFLVGALTSTLIYRIALHPLRKFPGPFGAKVSALWLCFHAPNCDGYLRYEEAHNKYGKYVRLGPNSLSTTDSDVLETAFTAGKLWRKAEWYDGAQPHDSLHTTRDRAMHDRRRRIWAPAFSDKALREYEPKVRYFNDKLVERIKQFGGGPVNASKWTCLYAFDVMGRLAFGRDYGSLDSGESHWAIELLNEGMEAAPTRTPTWLFRVILAVPGAATGFYKFLGFCKQQLEWRIDNPGKEGDITGWLLKQYKDWKKPAEDTMLQGDSRLIIVAGSDTTAATMTFLLYELAKKPEEVRKLREELTPLAKGDWTDVEIRNAPLLNGAINESLRMHPPVPSGTERLTPKGGVQIGDVFLPGDVSVWFPQYVMGRDEDNYEQALEFVPERWYSKPEMIKRKNAFAPFSLGAEGCIGKNLAMIELRTLTTQLILNFDIALAPGEDGHRLLYKTRDHFTLGLGDLDLVFTPASS